MHWMRLQFWRGACRFRKVIVGWEVEAGWGWDLGWDFGWSRRGGFWMGIFLWWWVFCFIFVQRPTFTMRGFPWRHDLCPFGWGVTTYRFHLSCLLTHPTVFLATLKSSYRLGWMRLGHLHSMKSEWFESIFFWRFWKARSFYWWFSRLEYDCKLRVALGSLR